MTQKPPANPDSKPGPDADPPKPGDTVQPPPKKKLSLDISDVSEVLERKISP
jgi:hypothetical protein